MCYAVRDAELRSIGKKRAAINCIYTVSMAVIKALNVLDMLGSDF